MNLIVVEYKYIYINISFRAVSGRIEPCLFYDMVE